MIKNTIQTGRFVVPYRIYGDTGPHLVMLNGVQQSMAMWSSFVRRFASSYRIVLFDLPGQGRCQVLDGPVNASLDEEVDILDDIIKETGVKDVTLCSASWGGVVAMAYAARFPERVPRMILGSLGTRPNDHMIETIRKGGSVDEKDRKKMSDILINSFGQNLPDAIKTRIIKQFTAMTPENIRGFYEHGLFVIAAKNLSEVIDLNSVRADTILVNGENDTILDLEDVRYLARQLPRCRLEIVEGIGHFLHLESDAVLDVYAKLLPKA